MRYKATGFITFVVIYILYTIFPTPVFAHAFGTQYNLPIPVSLYVYGGAATIILSFLVVGFFLNKTSSKFEYPSKRILLLQKLAPSLGYFFKYLIFGLFILAILTGLFGINEPTLNFNMTFFWITFYLGVTYLSAILGNFWSMINPWSTAIELLERARGSEFREKIPYPKLLGHYPALFFYFVLIWSELVDKTTPFTLSLRLLAYTAISIGFVVVFGKKVWLEKAEVFSVLFRFFSKISVIEYRQGRFYLRPPLVGLLRTSEEVSLSTILFVLFMLSSTFFDGFRSTTVWFKFEIDHLVNIEVVLGALGYGVIHSLFLILFLLAFLLLFSLISLLMKVLIRSRQSVPELMEIFVFSLVPIAFVYNFAHYYTLFLIQGQAIISLISDPFGFSWNLFGTGSFTPNIGLLGARFIWNSQVATIIIGHIGAILIAHLISLKTFSSHKKALISQFPMLILMVFYTMAGLWILSQPLTGGA